MKRLFHFAIAFFCVGAFLPAYTHVEDHTTHTQTVAADTLKDWLDRGKTVVILDARTKEYDDGNRLPGAKSLPYDAKDEEIRQIVPSKESLLVVYCSNPRCPASKFLADRLVEMGYTNVFKYAEGISDWKSKGYPIDKTQK
jgi:rhodanese-related sulfurtransferase